MSKIPLYSELGLTSWERKFFRVALEIESWSKHPTTKVGCCVVDSDQVQLSGGYNGLPRKANDAKILIQTDKPKTSSTTVHAEANAVAAAARKGHALLGAVAYVTRPVCSQCAALLVQAGIVKVLALHVLEGDSITGADWSLYDEWGNDLETACALLKEVGVGYYVFSKRGVCL